MPESIIMSNQTTKLLRHGTSAPEPTPTTAQSATPQPAEEATPELMPVASDSKPELKSDEPFDKLPYSERLEIRRRLDECETIINQCRNVWLVGLNAYSK